MLRVEDTDRQRSSQKFTDGILNDLTWLKLNWDGDVVYQSRNAKRHREIADILLDSGHAYRCCCTERLNPGQADPCRENDVSENVSHVIRFATPRSGEVIMNDMVQKQIRVPCDTIDPMVIIRSDGSATFLLACMVDDHDMGVTHVIRGDDHISNTVRQILIYQALGWEQPKWAHIPLIHSEDGAKLSKRLGAISISEYKKLGILPEGLCNYMLRLGWSHGNDEVITQAQAIEWFDIPAIGKSSARTNQDKLNQINQHYMRNMKSENLLEAIKPLMSNVIGRNITQEEGERINRGIFDLAKRSKNLVELADQAMIYCDAEIKISHENLVDLIPYVDLLSLYKKTLEELMDSEWNEENLEKLARNFVEAQNIKLKELAQPLRIAITGKKFSPSIFSVMDIMGKDLAMKKICDGMECCGGE